MILASDGASRAVDRSICTPGPKSWPLIRKHGPQVLIDITRDGEINDPDRDLWPRSKAQDDATVVYWQLDD